MNPEQIRQLRKDVGMSRENFARLFLVSPITITTWENGTRTPPPFYVANMMRLRQRVDAMRAPNNASINNNAIANNNTAPNNNGDGDIGNVLLNVFLAGGVIAFLAWLFANDDN